MSNIVLEIEGLFDVDEAQRELQISYRTLYRWIGKGLISPVKIGGRNYITKSDVERLKVERRSEKSTGVERAKISEQPNVQKRATGYEEPMVRERSKTRERA